MTAATAKEYGPTNPADVRAALSCIPASDRDLWLKMGMAVKDEFGDEGFPIWNEWSESDEESYREKTARQVWKSFNKNGVGIGSLFFEAKQRGYQFTGKKLEPATAEQIAAREQKRQDDERKAREKTEHAKQKANALWSNAAPAISHPYLARKGIKPQGVRVGPYVYNALNNANEWERRQKENCLLIPLRDTDGAIWNLQAIFPDTELDRDKGFLSGGKVSGLYFSIGKPSGVICICEGYATGASIHEATGHAVAVAFNAGNLGKVAKKIRDKYPEGKIILCADHDQWTKGNPGATKATEAAQAINGALAVPQFKNTEGQPTDFNDLHASEGLEAVRAAINNALTPTVDKKHQSSDVLSRCMADIEAKPINWLWYGKIARGKVSMIAGHPGLGKSQITASLAAIVSTGGKWPVDRTKCARGQVVFLSAEDSAEDTIRPRLEAAGADLTRIYTIDAISEGSGENTTERTFNLAADVHRLALMVERLGDVSLLIVDPITAYLGNTDSHKNADIRALLTPLTKMAEERGIAVVCVTHLNKGGSAEALMRFSGSLAFVAAARAAFIVAKDPDNGTRRLFLPVKNNIGKDETGLAFSVESVSIAGGIETSRIAWEADAVTITADEALSQDDQGSEEGSSALDEAKEWLSDFLADGPQLSNDVKRNANQAGIAWATVKRAKAALGIKPTKDKTSMAWSWSLTADGGKVLNRPRASELEHLEQVEHVPFSPEENGTSQEAQIEGAQDAQTMGTGAHWQTTL